MSKRTPTTKDINLLYQLHRSGQLQLAPEFQRNSVWPPAAKAYLIDSIIVDRPIPLLFFQRGVSAQTGQPSYSVIDGQQRLRAIFDFLDNRLKLTQSDPKSSYYNKRFSDLPQTIVSQLLQYDLIIQELSGYSESDIKDMFVRMNKYVVNLSPQEIRHAKEEGKFRDLVEDLGALDWWGRHRVFTPKQTRRFRPVEFSAEVVILLIEGPQDKKKSIDLYYGEYRQASPFAKQVKARLLSYLSWTEQAMPDLKGSRFRKPVDLYSFLGALDKVSREGKRLPRMTPSKATSALESFDRETRKPQLSGTYAKYVVAASQQTDNIRPRQTRIEALSALLREVYG